MKVTIVSNFDLESGRGPVFRLINILPILNKNIDLRIISLQEPDVTCEKMLNDYRINYSVIRYASCGWSIVDCEKLSDQIISILKDNQSDLCVLGWELWDLAIELYEKIKSINCVFAVVFHSIPFVDALPFPKNYEKDIETRIQNESNKMIKNYLSTKAGNARDYIHKLNIISINETISYYLNTYFQKLNYFKAYPGYALNTKLIDSIDQPDKIYDYAFMSKLETSKGIFDLIEIASEIKKINKNSKIRIIGDFLYPHEKEAVLEKISLLKLEDNISFAGWLSDEDKYKELKKAHVFLYPSLTGDTFSFCMLEALACGLGAVSYDTPFSRIIYSKAPVERVFYRDVQAFASVANKMLLSNHDKILKEATCFVSDNYSDWTKVALAEIDVYHEIFCKKT